MNVVAKSKGVGIINEDIRIMPETTMTLEQAIASGDLAQIVAIASAQLKAQKVAQKEQLEKNQGALADLTKSLMKDVEAVFNSYLETATELVGDKAAISAYLDKSVWKASVVKSAVKGTHKSSGKPAGKFDMSTEELIKLYGDEEISEGKSFKEAMEVAKVAEDKKNATYQVRVKLIKYHQQASA